MKQDEYLINKLTSDRDVKHFLDYMKNDKHQCYIAGGALTCIANGTADQIEDYDVYFANKKSCVEAIRYMKENDPHVGFISDKSITYVMQSGIKIQFIYYDFYEKASDIFEHYDFTINMAAYRCLEEDLIYDENFWMHNAQRYLSVNVKTKFPILTMLRLDKYKSRGYKPSRNEIIKLGLAISQLNIDSWESFKEAIGNSYGFTLADFKVCKDEEFSIQKGIDILLSPSDESVTAPEYLYPVDCVDFVVDNEPLKVVMLNEEEYFIDSNTVDCEDSLRSLIEDDVLSKVEVCSQSILSDTYYVIAPEGQSIGDKCKPYGYVTCYTKSGFENVYSWNNRGKVIYRVSFEEIDIKDYSDGKIKVDKCKLLEVVCRSEDVQRLIDGEEVDYHPKVKSMESSSTSPKGHAFSENSDYIQGEIATIKRLREQHLKRYVRISGKEPCYAHSKFSGYILEGGEDITAYEVLLLADDFNLSFGGECSVGSDGEFRGRYNTD